MKQEIIVFLTMYLVSEVFALGQPPANPNAIKGKDYCIPGSDSLCKRWGSDYCCAFIDITDPQGVVKNYHACSSATGIY